MAVWFKRVLIGAVAAMIVALVGIAIFLLTFDPNAYKHKLQEVVFDRYQRVLTINGDIQLSLFPRIGLAVNDVALSGQDGADRFASVDSARVAVAIWPLLSNHLVIDHVTVSGFSVWIERADDGSMNFQDLLGADPARVVAGASAQALSTVTAQTPDMPSQAETAQPPGGDMRVDIAGLDLKGGAIHWLDRASGMALQARDLEIKTGRIVSDLPFDVSVKGRLHGDTPRADAAIDAQAQIRFNLQRKTYAAQRLSIQSTGRLPGLDARQAVLRGNLAYSAYSQMLNLGGLELQVQGDLDGERPITGLNASVTIPRLEIDRSQRELQLEKLVLRARGAWPDETFDLALDAPRLAIAPQSAAGERMSASLKITGERTLGLALGLGGIGGNAESLSFKEVKVDTALQQGGRLTRATLLSPATLNLGQQQAGLSAIKGDIHIEDPLLPEGAVEFPFIGSVALDVRKDTLQADLNAVLDGSRLNFNLKAEQLRKPRAQFSLAADVLNLDTLLGAAPQASPTEAPASEDAEREPAQDDAQSPAATPSAEEVSQADTSLSLPWLTELDARGTVKVGQLMWRNLALSELDAALSAAQGRLQVSQLSATLYQGTLKGGLTITDAGALQVKAALDQVDLGALDQALSGQARVAGLGALQLDLSSSAGAAAHMLRQLDGSVRLRMRDGAVKGMDVVQSLRDLSLAARSLLKTPLPETALRFDAQRQTDFTALDAAVSIKQGVATLGNLSVSAPYLRIRQGKPAQADLGAQTVDLVLNVSVVNTGRGQEGAELRALQGVTVPLQVQGSLADPGYRILWEDMGSRLLQQAVRKGLAAALQGEDAPQDETPAADAAAAPAPATEADTIRDIGNALKGLLR